MESSRKAWLGVGACLCTTLLGLGLARFAYTPLIPALIAAHWFAPGQAVYLGAANIGGYLAGALLARQAARLLGVRAALRVFMLLAAGSLLACADPAGFAWFLAWRLLSGFAGAGLMVLGAPSVLPLLPERHRGLAGGLIFLGIGLGVVGSGTVLPTMLHAGVTQAWLGLAACGFVLTAVAWFCLPADAQDVAIGGTRVTPISRASWALFTAYGASAIGQVPAILFLADFVARGLGEGVGAGARIWAIFGLGALAGPIAAGTLADRIGFVATLRGLWASQVISCLCLAFWPTPWVVPVSGFWLGAGVPAFVVLVLGRSQALSVQEADARRRAWSFATTAYALGQAIGAYALSYFFARSGRYDVLYATGAVFMLAGFFAGEISRHAADRQG